MLRTFLSLWLSESSKLSVRRQVCLLGPEPLQTYIG